MIRRNHTNRKDQSFLVSPLESAKQPVSCRNKRGQNVTEYLILVAGVLTVVILAANSRGIFTQGVNRALNMMANSVESIQEQCLTSADDLDGRWGSWSSWSPCVSCSQTRSHTCDSPAPRCNGAPCAGGNGLIETESRACTGGDSTWSVGSCGACTGDCGSTEGTCPQTISCSGGCCDPPAPSPTRTCPKTAYPDVWVEVNDWVCSVLCGTGTETQTVTCSGPCCDNAPFDPVSRPGGKPPATRSCTITCDNGDFCDGAEGCDLVAGCQPGTPPACDNGVFCDGVETCSSVLGSCQAGTPPAVDDGIPCTTDYCDTGLDQAAHIPDNAVCDDGLLCNGAEYCDVSLGCQAGSAPTFDDGVGCTIDTCDDVVGTVIHTPDNTACDNGLFCDGAEYCHVSLDCQAGSAPVIDDGVGCTGDSCDEANDVVVHAPNNASCDNSLFCDGAEYCHVSLDCQAGSAPVINDGVNCTDDSCDEANDVVVHAPNNASCDNNLFCDGVEYCDALNDCQPGTAPVCDDGNVCTGTETCSNATGACQPGTVLTCSSDGLFCSGTESCNMLSGCFSGGNPCSTPAVCQEALDSCCGNGVADGFEQCDWNGPDLNGQTCSTLGWGNGPLECSGACFFRRGLCERQLCADWGGSWNSTCQCCQFISSSCPVPWYQHQNWSRTTSRYCPDPTSSAPQCQYTAVAWTTFGCLVQLGPNACNTGGHAFANNWTIETCTIWARGHWYQSSDNTCRTWCTDDYEYGTCYATRTSVGCRYY